MAVLVLCDGARAAVGQCWVLSVCGIEGQLDARQQKETRQQSGIYDFKPGAHTKVLDELFYEAQAGERPASKDGDALD